MIYLNQAATSWPKPERVKESFIHAMNSLPSGQFRSAGISDNGDVFGLCRERLASLFGVSEPDRIFFSSGATESLNLVLAGLGIRADSIITTVTEHNSVLRPLYNHPLIKGEPAVLPCDERGFVDPSALETEARKGKAKLFVLNHCSNVTGAVQDLAVFGEIAKRYELLFLADLSQSAGCLPVDAEAWKLDGFVFTGHKSLLGPQGTGGYYIRSGVPFAPLKFGGTGLDSRRIRYTEETYEFEPGTQNACGIAALSEAVGLLLEKGVDVVSEQEHSLIAFLKEGLSVMHGINLIDAGEAQGPVISICPERLAPADLAYILQNSYEIVTRAGLHCAPLIHEYIGSAPKGTVRISIGLSNTREEAEKLLAALAEILMQ